MPIYFSECVKPHHFSPFPIHRLPPLCNIPCHELGALTRLYEFVFLYFERMGCCCTTSRLTLLFERRSIPSVLRPTHYLHFCIRRIESTPDELLDECQQTFIFGGVFSHPHPHTHTHAHTIQVNYLPFSVLAALNADAP